MHIQNDVVVEGSRELPHDKVAQAAERRPAQVDSYNVEFEPKHLVEGRLGSTLRSVHVGDGPLSLAAVLFGHTALLSRDPEWSFVDTM